jgi:hypothetical protein
MALSPTGAQVIETARKESGKIVFVGYMRRYAQAFLRVKEMVKELKTGDIKYGELSSFVTVLLISLSPSSGYHRPSMRCPGDFIQKLT